MGDWDDEDWEEQEVKKPAGKPEWDDESDEEEQGSKAPQKFDPAPRSPEKPSSVKAAASAAPEAPTVDQKVVTKDSMEELEINLQQHVDAMVKLVLPKLQNAQAKQAPMKFFSDALKGLQVKLTLQEAEQLQKSCKEMHTKRKKKDQEMKKKKIEEDEAKKKAELAVKNDVNDDDFFSAFM
mmetsp:Transcript_25703/g.34776  ORF Transcript_25703/g.34776 Transcript_25703/m.34776 type:complete len:181 (+) Transcript_25703:57-599(+)